MSDKILNIFTIVSSRLDLLELQFYSFKTFVKMPFKLHVVDNSDRHDLKEQFKHFCDNNNLNYISTSSNSPHGAGFKHADCLNFIWQNYILKNLYNYVMICDSDIFCIKPLVIEDIFENKYIIAAPMQHRRNKYFWIGPTVCFFDMSKLINKEEFKWDAGVWIDGVALDTGGQNYFYMEQYPHIKTKVKNLKPTHHLNDINKNKHCLPAEYQELYKDEYSIEFFSNYFLHYARGSNWDGASENYHSDKTKYVSNFIFDLALNKVKAVEHDFLIENEYYGKWKYSD